MCARLSMLLMTVGWSVVMLALWTIVGWCVVAAWALCEDGLAHAGAAFALTGCWFCVAAAAVSVSVVGFCSVLLSAWLPW